MYFFFTDHKLHYAQLILLMLFAIITDLTLKGINDKTMVESVKNLRMRPEVLGFIE